MFARRRLNRPVELGPYPLETLARDETQIAVEQRRAKSAAVPPRIKEQSPLLRATLGYQQTYATLRDITPFARQAPVPDDLGLRTRDIKGAGYFLDASQMGVCELPANAWLAGAATLPHSHAVAIMVELGAPIDADNTAAQWVQGIERNIATTRAAEISTVLSGQIAAMGFAARAHWLGESEVDLERLAVLAGLGVRTQRGLENPYVASGFALAVVTTDYELACDIPLHANALRAKGVGYFFGSTGAVSGMERWRQRRRPSHLGIYPEESLTRVAEPTTKIFADEVPRLPQRSIFYIRAAIGDCGPKPKQERPRWAYKHPLSQGLLRIMWANLPHQEGPVNDQVRTPASNPEANARAIKALSYHLGSAATGICEIPDYCWYSHRKDGSRIDPYHKYAVVMLIDQGSETFQGACGDDWISGSQSMRSYMRGAEIAGTMAAHLRELGFSSRAQTSLDSDVLHIPLMLWAGLGEQSRIGETAVHPFLGPRIKTVVLTTDFPLQPDQPIDFGLQSFCSHCVKCARECSSQAIPFGDKVVFNGYETWKPDSERCTIYRMGNSRGSACGRCIKVCPLTKEMTRDGPLHSRIGSWLGIHAPWLKPLLPRFLIWLDDLLGHGNPVDAKKWWLDLEVIGQQCNTWESTNYCDVPKATNRKQIQPGKSVQKKQKIAYFPASTVPPADATEPRVTDRKLGLEIAAQAETVAEAIARRKRGDPMPEWYHYSG
jgi:reductive dehalogenase